MTRTHYPESAIVVEAWGGHERFECQDAEVWIEPDGILVSYFDDEGVVVLEGRPDGAEGWTLSARSRPRRAFLRPMAEASGSYEGEIDELGQGASWRLRLGPPGPAP